MLMSKQISTSCVGSNGVFIIYGEGGGAGKWETYRLEVFVCPPLDDEGKFFLPSPAREKIETFFTPPPLTPPPPSPGIAIKGRNKS